ncbi:MAG: RNA polymerase sigma factor [Nitrospinaceae bacterium]|nr:MAG: RNA polymerase sigma factor [Nitrospinaceae bacterium]
MYRYCLVRVKDPAAAEEIVQVTFFAALQATHTFAGRSSEKSWLFGILKHKILDHFREVKKNRTFDLAPQDDQDPCEYNASGHWKEIPQHWGLDPEKFAENQALTEALTTCLDGLSDKFRQVFVLKEIEGLSTEEICNDFNIKPTNLWVILHRARNQLKKCLEIHWFDRKERE